MGLCWTYVEYFRPRHKVVSYWYPFWICTWMVRSIYLVYFYVFLLIVIMKTFYKERKHKKYILHMDCSFYQNTCTVGLFSKSDPATSASRQSQDSGPPMQNSRTPPDCWVDNKGAAANRWGHCCALYFILSRALIGSESCLLSVHLLLYRAVN